MTFNMLWILVAVFFIGIQVFTAVYVYRDAKDKNLAAGGWTVMNVFLPFIGILIYSVLNPKSKYPVQTEPVTSSKTATKTDINPPNSNTVSKNTAMLDTVQESTDMQKDSRWTGTIVFEDVKKQVSSSIAELVVQNGPRQSKRYVIEDGETTIGSRPPNTIIIESDDRTVSANQAIIQKFGETFKIINRSGTNKTKVNGQAMDWQELKDNDTIEMGSVKLLFWNRKVTAGNESGAGTPQA